MRLISGGGWNSIRHVIVKPASTAAFVPTVAKFALCRLNLPRMGAPASQIVRRGEGSPRAAPSHSFSLSAIAFCLRLVWSSCLSAASILRRCAKPPLYDTRERDTGLSGRVTHKPRIRIQIRPGPNWRSAPEKIIYSEDGDFLTLARRL